MKLKFLGGVEEVGKLGMLLHEDNVNLLFDYGMAADKPPTYPLPAPKPDMVFLTHSHLDHCGMLPWIAKNYGTEIIATPPTVKVTELLVRDSIKIAKAEGYPEVYNENDIDELMNNFTTMSYTEVMDIGPLEVSPYPAGHIPGAAMYEIYGDSTTVFTGDIHTCNMRLVKGAKPVKCDNLIIEGTYSGRNHPDRKKTERELIESVKETVENGGKAIIPCFAVGRTQEVMMILKNLKYNMWVDGMGKSISKIYKTFPGYIRSEHDLKESRRRFSEVTYSRDRKQARAEAQVIVATGGMLDGGPVQTYINDVKNDPHSSILLTGFQVETSNGYNLLNNRTMNIQLARDQPEQTIKVKCNLKKFDLSAHAGQDDLIKFVEGCDPENVVIMHSDDREPFAKELRDRNFNVILPKTIEEFEL